MFYQVRYEHSHQVKKARKPSVSGPFGILGSLFFGASALFGAIFIALILCGFSDNVKVQMAMKKAMKSKQAGTFLSLPVCVLIRLSHSLLVYSLL